MDSDNQGPEQKASQGKILLVDDNADNLDLLSKILSKNGYEVGATTSGLFAIQSIVQEKPDLILLDIRMPGINGYEICRRIRKDPSCLEIPIIFISALSETTDKIRAFEVGGVDYITKPFQTEEVLARVKTHTSLLRMRKHLEQHVLELEEKNRQLEKLNKLFVDREFRINELKEKIKKLEKQIPKNKD